MQQWIQIPLADVIFEGCIGYINIISLEINSKVNYHATASVRLLLDASVEAGIIKDTKVKLSTKDGQVLFSGKCIGVSTEEKNSYKEAVLSIISNSYELAGIINDRTFQNPNKSLEDIAMTVVSEAGLSCEVCDELSLSNVICQSENNWEFLLSLSNQYGLSLWTSYRNETVALAIGKEAVYRNVELGKQSYVVSEQKHVDEFRKSMMSDKGNESLYEHSSTTYKSYNCFAATGDSCNNGIIISTRLTTEKGVLINEICVLNATKYILSNEAQRKRALSSQILSGKVIEVSTTSIKVEFDVDGSQAKSEAVEIPYESILSNTFYSMPDEEEQVFVYIDNQGGIVCLGSKRTDTLDPFFEYPEEKTFGALESLFHLKKDAINFSTTRKTYEGGNPLQEISISMKEDEGVGIYSQKDITVSAANELFLGVSNGEKDIDCTNVKDSALERKENLISGDGNYNSLIESRSAEYVPLKGIPNYELSFSSYFDSLGARVSNELERAGENILGGAKDLIFWDLWHQATPPDIDNSLAECTSLNISFFATKISLSAGSATLVMGVMATDEITISAGMFSWLGKDITDQYPIKADELRDAWEVMLDIVLAGLAIAAAVCVIAGTGGAAAPLIIGGVAGAIALTRGDYFSAITSVVSMAFGVLKLPATFDKVFKTVSCIYGGVQGLYQDYKIILQTLSRVQNADNWGMAALEWGNCLLQIAGNSLSTYGDAKELYGTYRSDGVNNGGENGQNNPGGDDTHTQTNPTDAENQQNGTHDGDPVNVATGALTERHTDLRLKDIREDFRVIRSYNSTKKNPGRMLGERWLFQFESSLYREGDKCSVYLPDDHLEHFVLKENGVWNNTVADKNRYLLTTEEEGYLLQDMENHNSYFYGKDGFIRYAADMYHNRTVYTYTGTLLNRITLESGQYLEFYYEGKKLARLVDGQGRTYHYHYAGELLESVTYPNGGILRYEYTPEGYITRIHNENGKVYLNNHYDRKGRVVRQETADGEEYIFFYNDVQKETTVTKTGLNRSVKYRYNRNNLVECTTFEDRTTIEKKYDANEKVIWEKDRLGNITQRSFNEQGQLVGVIYPNGLNTVFTYNEQGKCISVTDNQGKNCLYTYNEKGAVTEVSIEVQKGRFATIKYEVDEHGRILSQTYADGAKKTWMYSKPFSHPTAYCSPEKDEIQYELDEYGRMTMLQNAYGERHYAYNSYNFITMICDEENNVTRYTYDLTGLRTGIKRPEDVAADDGRGITYRYDAMDHLLGVEDACGVVYAKKVNSEGKTLKLIAPDTYNRETQDGEGVTYKYDVNGNCTHRILRDGAVYRFFYDANGNMIKAVLPEDYNAATDDGEGRIYTYDSMNRLRTVQDKHGVLLKKNTYDLSGRIIRYTTGKMQALGMKCKKEIAAIYKYNNVGWLMEERIPVREKDDEIEYRLRTFEYDLRGNVICEKRYQAYQDEQSEKGRILLIHKKYDKNGRLIKVNDSLGACIEYAYNERNKVRYERRKIREGVYQEKEYTYTESGRLSSIIQSADAKETSGGRAITALAYDRNGNLTRITTPTGNEMLYTYDRAGKRTGIEMKQRDGSIRNVVHFEYDGGNHISRKITDGREETYTYDVCGRRSHICNIYGKTAAYKYDKNGRLTGYIAPQQYDKEGMEGKATTYLYENDRLTKILLPDGSSRREYTYNMFGDAVGIKEVGVKAAFAYDLGGRRTAIKSSGQAVQMQEYDPWGRVTAVTDGNGNTTGFELDDWGRVRKINRADGGVESFAYDEAGNMIEAVDGLGHATHFEYNEMNRLSRRIDQAGEEELWSYNAEGRIRRYLDRNGNELLFDYNMYGELTRRSSSGGMEEVFGYTQDGLLDYCIGGGMRYDYCYDSYGRLTEKKASGRTLLSYEYDDNNHMTARIDLTGKRTEYIYDELGSLLSVSDEGVEQARYNYDSEHRLSEQISGALSMAYAYDMDGNISRIHTTLSGEDLFDNHYQYDANGNCTRIAKKDSVTEYAYDCMNRLTEAFYPNHAEKFAYDYADNRISREYYSYLSTQTTGRVDNIGNFNNDGEMDAIVSVDDAGRMDVVGKTDDIGAVPSSTDILGGQFFRGDTLGAEAFTGKSSGEAFGLELNFREEYVYDERNRLTERHILSADSFIQSSLEQGGVHGENLQQEAKQVIHYTYDANGNMIKDDKAEYHYDGFNRLSEVRTTDGRYQRNTYDAEGLRAELIENNELVRFLYHNGEVVAETNEKQETTRYIRGLSLISSDSEKAKTYYHYASDERGSITDIVKAAVKKKLAEDAKKEAATQNPNHEESPVGNVTTTATEKQQETGVLNHYEYDAFGNTLVCEEKVANRFRFTGEIYDSVTGQYYLRARFYNPVLGRFIQEDDRYDDGLNLYAYCRNNPVKYTDPSGHGTTSGSDRVDDNADFYEDMYDSQYDTIPEYEDFLQDMQDAQNEGTNQSALYDLVDEMNQSGGLDAEDQSTIHDWADEYGVDYDSLGVIPADESGSKSKWWHEGYVDNLSDTQILLGVKQSNKGLSTLGSSTRETAMSAGKAWVGDNYNIIKDGAGNVLGYSSADGMRAFRIQYKPKEGMWRANFQENIMVNNPYPNPGQHSSQLKNVHIDILD